MKLSPRFLRRFPIASVGLFTAVSIFQSLAFLFSYESGKSNYFTADAPLPMISYVLSIVGLAWSIALIRLLPKSISTHQKNLPCPIASLPIALGFLTGATTLALSDHSKLALLTVAFLLLAACYALLVAFAKQVDATWKALGGFSAVLACILLNAIYYFDTTLEMNAPIKITLLVGLLSAMLYFTAELRYLLEKPAAKLHVIFSVSTLALGGLTAIPLPLAFAVGLLNRPTTPEGVPMLAKYFQHPAYVAGAFVVLGVSVGAAIRLWAQLRAPIASESPIPETDNHKTTSKEQEEA